MQTRAEIEEQYQVVRGFINSPGKFEGEAVFVPALWNSDRGADEIDADGDHVMVFEITDNDIAEFPELEGEDRTIRLWESNSGFVVRV